MNISSNKRRAPSNPCSEFLNEFNQQRDVSLAELPNVVGRCFEKLQELNFRRNEKFRQHVCDLVVTWGISAAKIEDRVEAVRVHQVCINMLLQLNTTKLSIECVCKDGTIQLTDVDYQVLILSCPSLNPQAFNLRMEVLSSLLAFLKHEELSTEVLAPLYVDIEQIAPLQLKNNLLMRLHHAMESQRSLKLILLTYFSYKNTAIRKVCADLLGFLLKTKIDPYPFTLNGNRYVSPVLPHNHISEENEPELFKLVRGFECLRTKDIPTLAETINDLITLEHQSMGLTFLLLHYYLYHKDMPKALEQITDIVRFKPEIPDYHFIRANIAFMVNNIEALQEESAYMISQFPDDPRSITYWVQVQHLQKADDQRCMEAITHVICEHHFPLAFYVRSQMFYQAENHKRALQDLHVYIRHSPEDFNGWFLAAEINFQMGEWKTARTLFTEALKMNPINHEARLRRAAATFHLGRIPQAIKDLQRILKKNPRHVEALLLLASYSLPRDFGTADRALRTLESLQLDDPRIVALVEKLENLTHIAPAA